jgi:hypothetical protein
MTIRELVWCICFAIGALAQLAACPAAMKRRGKLNTEEQVFFWLGWLVLVLLGFMSLPYLISNRHASLPAWLYYPLVMVLFGAWKMITGKGRPEF